MLVSFRLKSVLLFFIHLVVSTLHSLVLYTFETQLFPVFFSISVSRLSYTYLFVNSPMPVFMC